MLNKTKFPGFSQMTVSEVTVFAKTLEKEGYTSQESLEFMEGIDRCLNIQASASIINRFTGKRQHNRKTARDILFEAATQIPIPERLNNNE